MADKHIAYLLILGHHEGLAWVLRNQRMAFSTARAREAQRLVTEIEKGWLFGSDGVVRA